MPYFFLPSCSDPPLLQSFFLFPMAEIQIECGDEIRSIPVYPELTLAQNLFAAGFYKGVPLCSGLGQCGRCRVCFLSLPPDPGPVERALFSPARLLEGWRLACRQYPGDAARIRIPDVRQPRPSMSSPLEPFRTLAIDVGTTAVKWRGIRRRTSEEVRGHCLNPQVGSGSDVMARMGFALHGAPMQKYLKQVLVEWLHQLIGVGEDPRDIPEVVITGNAVMIYFLLEKSLHGLAAAPYTLEYTGDESVVIDESLAPVYIPPLLSPFIGADISCGILHLTRRDHAALEYPFVLADFGTNGEFVLALSPEKYLVTSVAMGPALEGVGLSKGKMAGAGVCTGFLMTPGGIIPEAGSVAHGISGSGYLSLVALLGRLHVLNEDGGFQEGKTPLARKTGRQIREKSGTVSLWLEGCEVLTGGDVEEILKVKASCNYALEALLTHAGLHADQIARVFLAGSLGENVAHADLLDLGFFPLSCAGKILNVGNTSLAGAWDLLNDAGARTAVSQLRDRVTTIVLAEEDDFTGGFVRKMHFAYC